MAERGVDGGVAAAGPDGASVLVYESVWDLAADADAFHAAASMALAGLRLDGTIVQDGSRVVIGIRSGNAPAGAALEAILRGLATSNAR